MSIATKSRAVSSKPIKSPMTKAPKLSAEGGAEGGFVPKAWLTPREQIILRLLLVAYQYGLLYGRKGLSRFRRNHWARLFQLRLLIFMIAWIRPCEAVCLRRKDFDLEGGIIEINALYLRPGRHRRVVLARSLSLEACKLLARIFQELRLKPDDFILSGDEKMVKLSVVYHTFKVIAEAAGIDPRLVRPGSFRRLFPASSDVLIKFLLREPFNWHYKRPPRSHRRSRAELLKLCPL